MMLDVEKIRAIAECYTAQELFAALVWQRRFNEFDGEEIIAELAGHSHNIAIYDF